MDNSIKAYYGLEHIMILAVVDGLISKKRAAHLMGIDYNDFNRLYEQRIKDAEERFGLADGNH